MNDESFSLKSVNFCVPTREHLTEINRLIRISKNYWGYGDDFIHEFMKLNSLTEECLQKGVVFTATYKNKIIGVYCFNSHLLQLENFYIHPEYIGLGLGKFLWEHLIGRLRELGFNRFKINSDPHVDSFYSNLGAKKVSTISCPIQRGTINTIFEYILA